MKIAIGADHRGFLLKQWLMNARKDIEWIDVGAHDNNRSDYPAFALKVCTDILEQRADAGVLLCGSGIGMSIAANRFKSIYAGLCWSAEVARIAKEDDGINVLVIPSDFIFRGQSEEIFDAWHTAEFKGDRYADRLLMLDKMV